MSDSAAHDPTAPSASAAANPPAAPAAGVAATGVPPELAVAGTTAAAAAATRAKTASVPVGEPSLWYKDAIVYQVHVKAFCDGNGDGIGDLAGLLSRLDYLQSLGVTALWILPFYPSPLRDDGYDIADYLDVHPSYGTLHDFRALLREAHRRGLRVITELVINHTSDQHPWFQRARRAPAGSIERDYYVWSDTPEKYRQARIIFKDFEPSNWTWDPLAKAYYWHRFYHHQPDLNFDSPTVRRAIFKLLDFWFELGVDGLRLDAIPYLFEREGTNCENLPETHAFLREMRAHVDRRFADRMLLAEANQWPEDAAAYFGHGDSCHMAFHFPVMPRMFMALQMEDRYPIIDILEQTPAIPENCQWAIFLRNHDELTLEMVTDEERDYMYRVYAVDPRARINLGIRRRLAPLLANNRRKIELINILLFSLPGTPIIYYGDELGMGDNIYLGDRNGVRTPMQWSADRNAGFSRANPQQLYLPVIIDPEYQYESINVENQERNLSSMLYWMRRVIATRRRYQAFGRGTMTFVGSDNPKVLTFLRRHGDETILVVANLSRFAQAVEIDLGAAHAGSTLREVFSQNVFPKVRGGVPYTLTVGPHGHYWLLLEPGPDAGAAPAEGGAPEAATGRGLPVLEPVRDWAGLLAESVRTRLEKQLLPAYLPGRRWFRSKARRIQQVSVRLSLPVADGPEAPRLFWLQVTFGEGAPEVYLLPLQILFGARAEQMRRDWSNAVIAELRPGAGAGGGTPEEHGVLFDATYDESFRRSLLEMIVGRKRVRDAGPHPRGELVGVPSRALRGLLGLAPAPAAAAPSSGGHGENGHGTGALAPAAILPAPGAAAPALPASQVLGAEQSNTSVLFENKLFLKLYRKAESGENPDIELTRYLTEQRGFPHVPPFAGTLELRVNPQAALGLPGTAAGPAGAGAHHGEVQVVALLQGVVPNEGDAWAMTVEAAGRYLERVLSGHSDSTPPPPVNLAQLANRPQYNDLATAPPEIQAIIGGIYPERAALLGRRTAELHLALAAETTDPTLTPEPFTLLYQRSLLQSVNAHVRRVFGDLRRAAAHLDADRRGPVEAVLGRQQDVLALAEHALRGNYLLDALKTRIHGDYHLGQVLFTGKDFVIIDFEGEPARPLSERKLKRSPLTDVAGMLRSFHYAVYSALMGKISVLPEVTAALRPWAELWYQYAAGSFLRAYGTAVSGAGLVPTRPQDFDALLQVFLLDKAVYELNYELNNRPTWLPIPVRGIEQLLNAGAAATATATT